MSLVNAAAGWLTNPSSAPSPLNRLFPDVLMLELVSTLVSLLGSLMSPSVVVKLVLSRPRQAMDPLSRPASLVVNRANA